MASPSEVEKAAKAKAKADKLDFDLHVALIMRLEGVAKSTALFTAWSEGRAGLDKRLGKS